VALNKASPSLGLIFENYFKDASWVAFPPMLGFAIVVKLKVITASSVQRRGGSYNRGEAAAVTNTMYNDLGFRSGQ